MRIPPAAGCNHNRSVKIEPPITGAAAECEGGLLSPADGSNGAGDGCSNGAGAGAGAGDEHGSTLPFSTESEPRTEEITGNHEENRREIAPKIVEIDLEALVMRTSGRVRNLKVSKK